MIASPCNLFPTKKQLSAYHQPDRMKHEGRPRGLACQHQLVTATAGGAHTQKSVNQPEHSICFAITYWSRCRIISSVVII
jgi:hypothetical protein